MHKIFKFLKIPREIFVEKRIPCEKNKCILRMQALDFSIYSSQNETDGIIKAKHETWKKCVKWNRMASWRKTNKTSWNATKGQRLSLCGILTA